MDISTVSKEEFQRAHKLFTYLSKENIEFTIGLDCRTFWPARESSFYPLVTGVANSEQLSKVFLGEMPIPHSAFMPLNPFMAQLCEQGCVERVSNSHSEKLNNGQLSSVQFISTDINWGTIKNSVAWYITKAPFEEQIGDHTYRTVSTHSDFLLCVSEQHPLYNYLDVGHIIITTNDGKKQRLFITNQISLDTNNLMIAFALTPSSFETVLQDGVFISGLNTKAALLRIEKKMSPTTVSAYEPYKATIYRDFEKNAQHLIIAKLARSEISSIMLNDIKISQKGAKYEHVSIEAENFREVIFKTITPTAEFDIFSLIDTYTDYVEQALEQRRMNETRTAFSEAFTISFKINNIPLHVGVNTDNTRRKINGYSINIDELSKVLRRASCHTDIAGYNLFVSIVSRMSLRLHDVLANGQPVKTVMFANDYKRGVADARHPKLRFIKNGAVWSIRTHSGEEYPIRRIGEFIKKVYSLNTQARTSSCYVDGVWTPNRMNSCEKGLYSLLALHCVNITEKQISAVLEDSKRDQLIAIEKSKTLFKEVVKTVAAEEAVMRGVGGWAVQGDRRKYFVETESLKVYDYESGRYICIVNGMGEQGVGMDGLIGRLFALKNDSKIAKHITTL